MLYCEHARDRNGVYKIFTVTLFISKDFKFTFLYIQFTLVYERIIKTTRRQIYFGGVLSFFLVTYSYYFYT